MTKTLTYSGLVIAGLIVTLAFVTAKTYPQLIIASVLYPALVLLYLKISPRRSWKPLKTTIRTQPKLNLALIETSNSNKELPEVEVTDINKRAFFKLILTTGITFFLFSILGKRIEDLFSGLSAQTGTGIKPAESNNQLIQTGAALTEGYKISEINEDATASHYGFVNKDGGWLIMKEDRNESSFRYVKGSSDFPGNWKNRKNLKYDYFYKLF